MVAVQTESDAPVMSSVLPFNSGIKRGPVVLPAPPAPQTQAEPSDKFVWTQCWWPAMHMEGLDPKLPRHVDLLGKSLVVWADSKGQWHCFEDACPHRLAPLSEGRVEKDSLQCSYHGWEFNSQGACDTIPQIPPGQGRTKACSDKKACVRSYPTAVSQGLLWVWPEAGAQAAKQAAATPVEQNGVTTDNRTAWFRREVPLRVVSQLENSLDPAHVGYAHHGVQGNRNDLDRHLVWNELSVKEVTREGFKAVANTRMGAISLRFKAPFCVQYVVEATGFMFGPQVLFVPSKPGYSVMYANFPADLPFLPAPIRWLEYMRNKHFVALDHALVRNTIIDGDAYLLHLAERNMPLTRGVGLRTNSYLYEPGACDSCVLALRKWLTKFGGGDVPTCTPDDAYLEISRLLSKEQVLDRYQQHTKDCVHCMRAVRRIDVARATAAVVGVLAAVAAMSSAVAAGALSGAPAAAAAAGTPQVGVALAGLALSAPPAVGAWWAALQQGGLQQWMAGGLCGVVAALAVFVLLGRLRGHFFHQDYVHAQRE